MPLPTQTHTPIDSGHGDTPSRRRALLPGSLWAALAIGVLFAYVPRLGDPRGQTRPEEQFNMAISAEMHRIGAWATPTLDGTPTFFKPALLYWGERASYELFGLGVFGARLPAVVATLLLALVTALLARALGASAAVAALLCTGSAGFFMLGRMALTDAPLVLALTCAFGAVWQAHARGNGRWLWVAGAFVGLAVLAKGPVAGVIFLAGGLAFALLRRNRPRPDPLLRPADIAVGGVLGLLVAAPWYVLMLERHGKVFYDFFFVNMNANRFRSPWTLHSLGVLWGGLVGLLFPWTLLAVAAVVDALGRERRRDPRWLFGLCWAGATMLVFTLPAEKFPHYGLPALPPLALLVALLAKERAGSRALKWGAWGSALLCGAVAALVLGLARILPAAEAVVSIAALALAVFVYARRRIASAAAAGLMALAAVLGWLLPAAGFPPWPDGPVPQRPLGVLGPPGLVELVSGRPARYLLPEDVEPALARGDLVLLQEREFKGPPEEIVAVQRRFRSGVGFDEIVRAVRTGDPAPLFGRLLLVGRASAASGAPAANSTTSSDLTHD
jgi:4-amino-4-deoxy-L-arabinose transferase-like glycosyltransferase